MKRAFLILAIAALALPAAALGKGPSGASIDGPGSGGITFSGDGESGGTPLGDLTQQAGFFPAVFGQEPNPMLAGRPKGDLGPKHTISYTVPTPNNGIDEIKQDIYPYAKGGPVTYTEPGQKIFDMTALGGWFQATPQLKETLIAAGLPSRPPAAASSDGSSLGTSLFSAFVVALFLVAATVLFLRRRARPATA
ncbi:MAG: hypothetical protein ACRDNH_06880 [Gaiellaceae bacterium]